MLHECLGVFPDTQRSARLARREDTASLCCAKLRPCTAAHPHDVAAGQQRRELGIAGQPLAENCAAQFVSKVRRGPRQSCVDDVPKIIELPK